MVSSLQWRDSTEVLSLCQIVPVTHVAELPQITVRHDLLLEEHTLHTKGRAEGDEQIQEKLSCTIAELANFNWDINKETESGNKKKR